MATKKEKNDYKLRAYSEWLKKSRDTTYNVRLTCDNCNAERYVQIEKGTTFSWVIDVFLAGVKCHKCDTNWHLRKALFQ